MTPMGRKGDCGLLPAAATRMSEWGQGSEERKPLGRVRLVPETGCETTDQGLDRCNPQPSNSMLGCDATTPQDYPQ
jgi:hypothetical protein